MSAKSRWEPTRDATRKHFIDAFVVLNVTTHEVLNTSGSKSAVTDEFS